MLSSWRVPKTIQWIVRLFLIYLCIFTAFRIATVIFFKPNTVDVFELIPSFWLGLKYDLRWIAIVLSPIIALSIFTKFSPFHSARTKKIQSVECVARLIVTVPKTLKSRRVSWSPASAGVCCVAAEVAMVFMAPSF